MPWESEDGGDARKTAITGDRLSRTPRLLQDCSAHGNRTTMSHINKLPQSYFRYTLTFAYTRVRSEASITFGDNMAIMMNDCYTTATCTSSLKIWIHYPGRMLPGI